MSEGFSSASYPVVRVACRACQGTGLRPDTSEISGQKVCEGCKGAGEHLLMPHGAEPVPLPLGEKEGE